MINELFTKTLNILRSFLIYTDDLLSIKMFYRNITLVNSLNKIAFNFNIIILIKVYFFIFCTAYKY